MLLTLLATTVFVVAEEYGDADLKSQDISAAVAGLTFVVGFLMSMRINDAWKNWYGGTHLHCHWREGVCLSMSPSLTSVFTEFYLSAYHTIMTYRVFRVMTRGNTLAPQSQFLFFDHPSGCPHTFGHVFGHTRYEARSAWQKLIGGTSKLFQLCWAGSNSSANDEFTIIWRIKMYSLCLSFPVILKNALRGQSVQSDQRDLNFVMQGSPAAMKMIPHILNPKHAPLPRLRARWVTLLMRGEIDRACVVPIHLCCSCL